MNRFQIISELGAGGFGEAFRAWDSEHDVPVVLKRPLKKHLQRPDLLERFDREISRLLGLTHRYIVPIVDHGHDSDGLPYLAMRFLPAGSLADRKKPHPFTFLHCWLPGVAAALDFVHANGVVHRDVKPANIFFDTESQAYLGDFGIAKVIDEDLAQDFEHSLTSTGGEIGTYPYMGPEFFNSPRVLTGAYDQYALAVTVFEMICGTRPFLGDSSQLIAAHVTQDPPDVRRFSPNAPTSLCHAVRRALSKKPSDRFGTCIEFMEAALQDVRNVSRDTTLRHFLCPGCHRLVRVPIDLSGRTCRCTNCGVRLRVSPNCDALWRPEEDPSDKGSSKPETDGRIQPSRLPDAEWRRAWTPVKAVDAKPPAPRRRTSTPPPQSRTVSRSTEAETKALNKKPATLRMQAMAEVIDLGICFLPLPLWLLSPVFLVIVLVWSVVYLFGIGPLAVSATWQGTVGMRFLKIKVASIEGERIGLLRAFARACARFFIGMLGVNAAIYSGVGVFAVAERAFGWLASVMSAAFFALCLAGWMLDYLVARLMKRQRTLPDILCGSFVFDTNEL